jgi:hypothetical protein
MSKLLNALCFSRKSEPEREYDPPMSIILVLGVAVAVIVVVVAVWRIDRELDRRGSGKADDQGPPPIIDVM